MQPAMRIARRSTATRLCCCRVRCIWDRQTDGHTDAVRVIRFHTQFGGVFSFSFKFSSTQTTRAPAPLSWLRQRCRVKRRVRSTRPSPLIWFFPFVSPRCGATAGCIVIEKRLNSTRSTGGRQAFARQAICPRGFGVDVNSGPKTGNRYFVR